MKKLSGLNIRPLTDFYGSSTSNVGYVKSSKHSQKVFTLDWDKSSNRYYADKKSDFWKEEKIDLSSETGVYVLLDRFYIVGNGEHLGAYSNQCEVRALHTMKDNLKNVGIEMPKNLYGIKVSSKDKVNENENMVLLWDWLKEKLKNKIVSEKIVQKYVDRERVMEVRSEDGKGRHDNNWLKQIEKKAMKDVISRVNNVDGKSMFIDFMEKFEFMRHTSNKKALDSLRGVAIDLGVKVDLEDVEPTYDLKELKRKVDERYEMLSFVDSYRYGWHYDLSVGKALANYINGIDVCNVRH